MTAEASVSRLRVKICGITNYEDAASAAFFGATDLGFIMASSPRRVPPERVGLILKQLARDGLRPLVRTVGVFVNEEPRLIHQILRATGLDVAQIHGDETPQATAAFDFPWYRALRIGSVADFDRICPQGGGQWQCPELLVDAAVPGLYGGTGKTVSPEAACHARDQIRAVGKHFLLAGGIRAENVYSILEQTAPDGIDVASGVEEEPGKKSLDLLESLFVEIRRFCRAQGLE